MPAAEGTGMPDRPQTPPTANTVARLWVYTPFAFACPDLEGLYQDYHATHYVHSALIFYAASLCQCVGEWVLAMRGSYVSSVLPHLACLFFVSLGPLLLITWAPLVFQRHVHLCSTLWCVTGMFFTIMKRHAQAAIYINSVRRLSCVNTIHELLLICLTPLVIFGAPTNLPMWLIGEGFSINFWYPSGCELCRMVGGPEGRGLSVVLYRILRWHGAMPALGLRAIPPEIGCGIRLLFWDIQAGVLRGVGGLLRDVWWRRAFLKAHPNLAGPDGPARAATWPLGASHMVHMCIVLIVAFAMWDWTVTDVMLSVMLKGLNAGTAGEAL